MTDLAHNIKPIRPDVYEDALEAVYSAGDDWPRILRAAQVLSQSPVWWHQSTASHVFTAYSLHEAGLLKAHAEERQARLMLIEDWRVAKAPVKPPYSPQTGTIRDGLLFFGFAVAVLIVGLAA